MQTPGEATSLDDEVGFALSARFIAAAFAIFLTAQQGAQDARADDRSVEAFYRGKQINLYIGMSPGAAYDIDARLVAKHMSKHIPGNPAIVPKQMTGAGSLLAVT